MKRFLFLLSVAILCANNMFAQSTVAPKMQSIYYVSDGKKQISQAIPKGSVVICDILLGRYLHLDSTRRFLYSDTLITISKEIPNNVYAHGRYREYYVTSDTVTINNTTYVTRWQNTPSIIAGDTSAKLDVQTWKVFVYDSVWVHDTLDIYCKMWLTLQKCPVGTTFDAFCRQLGNVIAVQSDDYALPNKERWIKIEEEER